MKRFMFSAVAGLVFGITLASSLSQAAWECTGCTRTLGGWICEDCKEVEPQ